MSTPNVSRRNLLETGLAAIAAPMMKAAPERKRNVLFIASDDLCNRLGCYGDPIAQSPNFDRLARSGVRFDRSYCQYPWCSPSRTSLMTGLAPDTTRVWDLQTHFRKAVPDVVTLPQLFQKNGYFAARVGKIYHYGNPGDIGTPGLDDPQSWNGTLNPAGVDHTQQETLVTNYTPKFRGLGSAVAYYASPMKDEDHTDSLVTDAVIGLMEQHRNEPWFLGAGFYKPHCPWIVPSKYFDLYTMDRIAATPFHENEMSIAPPFAYSTKPANWGMSELQQREAIRAYYASLSFLDVQIGRLLDALEHLNLARNTTIVFWADHGYQLGEHGQWMKQTLFEPACRVPLLFAGAGIETRGRGCPRTVEHLDIYPTLIDLCALRGTPTNLQGQSLLPLLNNPSASWNKPAISQVYRFGGKNIPEAFRGPGGKSVMAYSIRNERYRYSSWGRGADGEELYDYQTDPREMHNLAQDPAAEPVKRELRASLESIAQTRGIANAPGTSA
jgi:iduronate 2-sulfatase